MQSRAVIRASEALAAQLLNSSGAILQISESGSGAEQPLAGHMMVRPASSGSSGRFPRALVTCSRTQRTHTCLGLLPPVRLCLQV